MGKSSVYYPKTFFIFFFAAAILYFITFIMMLPLRFGVAVFWAGVVVTLVLNAKAGASAAHYWFTTLGYKGRKQFGQIVLALTFAAFVVDNRLVARVSADTISPQLFHEYSAFLFLLSLLLGVTVNMLWQPDPEQTAYQ